MNKESYSKRIADAIKCDAGMSTTPKNSAGFIYNLFKTYNSIGSGDDFTASVEYAKGRSISYKAGEPNLLFTEDTPVSHKGEYRKPYFRYGRGYYTLNCSTINSSVLKFLLANADQLADYVSDRRLQINHMVIGLGYNNRTYEEVPYEPLYPAEIAENLEMISNRLNRLHGLFVHACKLEGYRISALDIPKYEEAFSKVLGMLPACDFSVEEFTGAVAIMKPSKKSDIVEFVNNQAGYTGRVDYTEFV